MSACSPSGQFFLKYAIFPAAVGSSTALLKLEIRLKNININEHIAMIYAGESVVFS
jgi:hypothetical protein